MEVKSKSGTCLHNFEIFILYQSLKKRFVLLPCRLSLFTCSINRWESGNVGNKTFVLSSSVFSDECRSYILPVTPNEDKHLLCDLIKDSVKAHSTDGKHEAVKGFKGKVGSSGPLSCSNLLPYPLSCF